MCRETGGLPHLSRSSLAGAPQAPWHAASLPRVLRPCGSRGFPLSADRPSGLTSLF